MAWLKVQSGSRERSFELDEAVLFVGSAEGAEVRLVEEGVEAQHCQVLRRDGKFVLQDLGSDLGTWVNGKKARQHELQDGDVIEVGVVSLRFDAGSAAVATPPAAGPVAATRRPARSSAGRGASRRDTGRGGAGRRPARSAAGRQRAGASARRGRTTRPDPAEGQPLVRRRLRESRGLPAPAVYAFIGAGLILGSLLLYSIVTREKIDVLGLITQAREARDRGQYDEATRYIALAKESIGPEHEQYDYVVNLHAEIAGHKGARLLIDSKQAELAQWGNNLQPFHDKFIETDDPQHKDDSSTYRYFAEFRLRPFLERFPESEHCDEARRWLKRCKSVYEESTAYPSTWWDHEIIYTFEGRLEHHGKAYAILADFKRANPGSDKIPECDQKMQWELERAQKYWEKYILPNHLEPALKAKSLGKALAWSQKAYQNLKGVPELEEAILGKVRELRQLAEAQGVELDLSGFEG